jgi:hypothetical protein
LFKLSDQLLDLDSTTEATETVLKDPARSKADSILDDVMIGLGNAELTQTRAKKSSGGNVIKVFSSRADNKAK